MGNVWCATPRSALHSGFVMTMPDRAVPLEHNIHELTDIMSRAITYLGLAMEALMPFAAPRLTAARFTSACIG